MMTTELIRALFVISVFSVAWGVLGSVFDWVFAPTPKHV